MLAYKKFFPAALVMLVSSHPVAGLKRYQNFFPARRQALVGLVNGTCSASYNSFLQGQPTSATDRRLGFWNLDEPEWSLIDCLLRAAPESVMAGFASGQLVLGLMPTLLGSLGPSSQELSLLLVLGNRQLLAICLALGSPFTNNVHSFDFAREVKHLSQLNNDFQWQASAPVLYFQYLIVFAAIANIAELSYEFAQNTPSVVIQQAPNYLPGLMAIVGTLMHLLVAYAFHFCVEKENSSTGKHNPRPSRNLMWFKSWLSQQLGARNQDGQRYVELNTTNIPYIITSWIAKVVIFTHIGWHVVAFSTVFFVSSQDAAVILFRYFASVCVCRMVAANEIAILGKTIKRKAKLRNPPVVEDNTYDSTDHRDDTQSIPLRSDCNSDLERRSMTI